MPIQTITSQVDGHKLEIVEFPAARGQRLQIRVIRLLGPALGNLAAKAMAAGQKAGLQSLLDADVNFGEIFTSLADTANEELVFRLLLDLLSSTKVDGSDFITEAIYNEIFIGKYILPYKIAAEVCKVNRFFDLGDIGNLLSSESLKTPPK